jgi:hypothetical protein
MRRNGGEELAYASHHSASSGSVPAAAASGDAALGANNETTTKQQRNPIPASFARWQQQQRARITFFPLALSSSTVIFQTKFLLCFQDSHP